MAVNDKKLVNAKALQDVAKGVYEQVQEDIKDAVAEEAGRVKDADEVKFESDMLTVNALGGIKAGQDLNGMTVQEVLTKLLYPHVNHVVEANSVKSKPVNGGTFEFGNTQTITSIEGKVTKKSNPISRVEIRDGSTVLQDVDGENCVKTEGIAGGGTITFTGLDIKVSTSGKKFTFAAYAPDENGNEKEVSLNTGTFTFVYPYYYGVVEAGAEITGDLVKGLNKDIKGKASKTYTYDLNNQCALIAYPKSYGNLVKALDPNSFDNIDGFTKYEVSIVGLDGTAQPYYVYVSGASTNAGFKFTFSY